MKYLQQLSCVLLVAVILSVTFSITAAASSTYVIELGVEYCDDYYSADRQFLFPTEDYFYVNNLHMEEGSSSFDFRYTIKTPNNELIFKEDKNVSLKLSNVYLLSHYSGGGHDTWHYFDDLSYLELVIYHTDGTVQYINDIDYSFSNPNLTFSSNFKTQKDVQFILIHGAYDFVNCDGANTLSVEVRKSSSYIPNVEIDISSEESGLLGGIIEWVKSIFESIGEGFKSMSEGFTNIFNKLTEGFSNMVSKLSEGFSNIVNSLIELPQKLWTLISDGLKNLFVPDAEYMTEYSNDWDTLLSSRFGAIYQVGDIITNFASNIKVSATTQTIYFPAVNLNSVGIPFSFGGYDIRVVPEGFDTIVNVGKTIISIVCTFLFINGLRKRYDEVMGVEQ